MKKIFSLVCGLLLIANICYGWSIFGGGGGAPIVATHAITGVIAGSTSSKVVVTNKGATGTITLTLPAANPNQFITVFLEATYTVNVDPAGTDRIVTLTDVDGDKILSNAVVGTFVSLMCVTSGKWHVIGLNGGWTDAN